MKKSSPLTKLAYSTAIGLALFSGSVATYGLTKFAPGAEWVVAAMGLLFETGKLTSFALVHKRMPRALKAAVLLAGTVLMCLNIAGVSGFLSSSYEKAHIAAQAPSHVAESTAHASASLVERQLAAAESSLAQARTALLKARDDRGRQKAAQAVVASATTERDVLVGKLAAAQASTAWAEGSTIEAGSEFAAVRFVAAATGSDEGTVAHALILVISSLPDLLAVLLIVAAGCSEKKPAPVVRKRRKVARRPTLKMVPHVQAA